MEASVWAYSVPPSTGQVPASATSWRTTLICSHSSRNDNGLTWYRFIFFLFVFFPVVTQIFFLFLLFSFTEAEKKPQERSVQVEPSLLFKLKNGNKEGRGQVWGSQVERGGCLALAMYLLLFKLRDLQKLLPWALCWMRSELRNWNPRLPCILGCLQSCIPCTLHQSLGIPQRPAFLPPR